MNDTHRSLLPPKHAQGVEKRGDVTGVDTLGLAPPRMICWRLCEEMPGVTGIPRLFESPRMCRTKSKARSDSFQEI